MFFDYYKLSILFFLVTLTSGCLGEPPILDIESGDTDSFEPEVADPVDPSNDGVVDPNGSDGINPGGDDEIEFPDNGKPPGEDDGEPPGEGEGEVPGKDDGEPPGEGEAPGEGEGLPYSPEDDDTGNADEIAIELEDLSGQSLFFPFVVELDPEASGGQYIVWPDNDEVLEEPADDIDGQVTIYFVLTRFASVEFKIRAKMGRQSNSFYYKRDFRDWEEEELEVDEDWKTEVADDFSGLAIGLHTLRILRREDGAQLDKVELSVSRGSIRRVFEP
ncbi:MAG: hypothetical protein KTR25_18980 [Myxococcales bacterium]|nr:hypothetical protein [Myxococcales bacterium]